MSSPIKYLRQMSDQCRRPSKKKEAFLQWLESKPEYKKRYPTQDEVIKAAKPKNSLIHDLFEWDVAKAARQQWREEAGYYLRHVEVIRINIKTQKVICKPVRAFIPLARGRYGRTENEDYIPAQRVANNPSMKKTVLDNAHGDFRAWYDRYKRYVEFLDEFSAVIKEYDKLFGLEDEEAA